jgi:hypothetical protein
MHCTKDRPLDRAEQKFVAKGLRGTMLSANKGGFGYAPES